MTTPTIMLLPAPLALRWAVASAGGPSAHTAGAIGMSPMFIFTASGHFAMPDLMVDTIPAWLPFRLLAVYASGVLELVIAGPLLWPGTRRLAGWTAMAVLVLFFPIKGHAALNQVPMGGHTSGLSYLLVRAPLQAIAMAWACAFAARPFTRVSAGSPGKD